MSIDERHSVIQGQRLEDTTHARLHAPIFAERDKGALPLGPSLDLLTSGGVDSTQTHLKCAINSGTLVLNGETAWLSSTR